ncbi:efflux RND transporter periplasmic adaptor subunit [Poseidonocella sedimentorum]|uniref:Multidrug efflux pump subunit AcrA (Membrane-fusion protein) n=1 Tax=Poseidonocella sedimentorum TaxID=871652 RepID=A0A1I6EDM8_9RHOB|nr:HlyD family efflux transporter periplasmic adaptor subunit [Poseidonocella sedimentorum]SFR15854.1 Multidrug efflux pump subunit AcrA (membrane-fusion protein) [Poseidonocella sedimentorum]
MIETSTDALASLAGFTGPVAEFWPALAEAARAEARAKEALIYVRATEGEAGGWRLMARAPKGQTAPEFAALCPVHVLTDLTREGFAEHAGALLMPVHLGRSGGARQRAVMVLRGARPDRAALLARLMPLTAAPLCFEAERGSRRAGRDAERMAQTIDLTARLQGAGEFGRAALIWVNGLAEQFACDQVTLIWRARAGMRLRAVSHAEGVERRTEASALAEQCAEEALAQSGEILWPESARDDTLVTHSHGQYAALAHPGHMITLPMITEDDRGRAQSLGAVLLERRRGGFTATEQWALRLHCDMAQAPLQRLERETGWLIPRVGRAIAPSIPGLLKPRTAPGRTLLALAAALAIAAAFIPLPFRITAAVVLRTDAMAYISAPFDGYVSESNRILGDVVAPGDALFDLDRSELELERNALLAELAQANREAEIQRAAGKLSEMQIARARAVEITTELRRVDLRLAAATARAPIAGIVVEGEPAKMIGEPVRRGDPVVTLAALSSLYVEAAVSERDLSFLREGQQTDVSLLARPDTSVPLAVRTVIPAAAAQDGETVFPVRLTQPEDQPDWWLPGMTGVAKISVDHRPLYWIASRRLVDYLRLLLWV